MMQDRRHLQDRRCWFPEASVICVVPGPATAFRLPEGGWAGRR